MFLGLALQAALHDLAVDAEEAGGGALVAAGQGHRLAHQGALNGIELVADRQAQDDARQLGERRRLGGGRLG